MAAQLNVKLCGIFSVRYFPVLMWGPPSKFVIARYDGKKVKSEINIIEDWETSQLILQWINTQLILQWINTQFRYCQ